MVSIAPFMRAVACMKVKSVNRKGRKGNRKGRKEKPYSTNMQSP